MPSVTRVTDSMSKVGAGSAPAFMPRQSKEGEQSDEPSLGPCHPPSGHASTPFRRGLGQTILTAANFPTVVGGCGEAEATRGPDRCRSREASAIDENVRSFFTFSTSRKEVISIENDHKSKGRHRRRQQQITFSPT